MATSPEEAIQQALAALQAGELPWAEALCLATLKANPEDPRALNVLGALAVKVGKPAQARAFWQRAVAAAPPRLGAPAQNLAALDAAVAPGQSLAVSPPSPAYLLIKSWGKGLWSDVDHVLGGLLAAEMTGRTPIVRWGQNCLFTMPGIDNAWPEFFEPVNELTIADAARERLSYFPPKWTAEKLREDDFNVWTGPGSRVTNLALLNRPENVVVADFHVSVPALMPWLDETHRLYGKSHEAVYRDLLGRYLRPRAGVMEEVEAFHARHLAGHKVLAVHYRGTDKLIEQHTIAEVNAQYVPAIDRVVGDDPAWRIFLLTDDVRAAELLAKRYGPRLVMTEVERSDNVIPVHANPQGDRVRRGLDVMRDTYLALRADHFIGNGASNVSAMIVHLREWPAERVTLLAPLRLYKPWPVLYRPR
jgi:hypothetical protein